MYMEVEAHVETISICRKKGTLVFNDNGTTVRGDAKVNTNTEIGRAHV